VISIQEADFDQGAEYQALAEGADTGAVVTFVGRVREFGNERMFLEHYAGMTENVLEKIIAQANVRWQLHQTRVIHRVGALAAGDQIVFVGVSSRHRADAFAACEFIMDFLKTEAPFWKKEGVHWVDAKESDNDAAQRWENE
jgi:molybdopterin synthase catalytic subunit